MKNVFNVVVAGLGGQGVLRASDILAQAAFMAGAQVKKSEVHGMSQRGGSVRSDVRFGQTVFSPMITPGEADALLAVDATQIAVHQAMLRPGGLVVAPALIDVAALPNKRSINVALLGYLSVFVADIPQTCWAAAVRAAFPGNTAEVNLLAFRQGFDKAQAGTGRNNDKL